MANVDFTEEKENFRSAKYGKDVRESLISIAEAVETACNNQLITVDITLSHAGQGAEAKAVGDAIDELRGAISDITVGGVDAVVEQWLDDHPEATTTVQDGSITSEKLTSALYLQTLNNYVTPQMFGAKGDGSTDDHDAIASMFASDNKVFYFPAGTYLLSSNLTVNKSGILIYGFGRENSIIKMASGVSVTFASPRVDIESIGFNGGVGVVTNSYRLNFTSCAFENSAKGIQLNNGYINHLLNCTVLHNTIGIDLNDSSYETIIENCVVDQNKGIGILVRGTVTGAIIKNNTIEGNQTTSGDGFGIVIYCNYASLLIDSNWFEANGKNTSVASADILPVGSYYQSDVADVITFAKTLFTYSSAYNNRGKIVISNNNFVYTKFGVICTGDNTKYQITGNAFRGVKNHGNQPVTISSRFLYSNEYDIHTNSVHNPADTSIDTEMQGGVNGTYIFTTLTYNSDKYIDVQKKIIYNGEPLYSEGGTTYTEGFLRIGNMVFINYQHTVTADDVTNNYITPTVTFPTRAQSYENVPLLVSRQGGNDFMTGLGVFNRLGQFALTGEVKRGDSGINTTALASGQILRFHGFYVCQ